MTLVEPVLKEIVDAHQQALASLQEAASAPDVVTALRLLHRCLETWELEVLVSQIGQGIGPETLAKLDGALRAFSLMKDLLYDLQARQATEEENVTKRAAKFTRGLLSQGVRPL